MNVTLHCLSTVVEATRAKKILNPYIFVTRYLDGQYSVRISNIAYIGIKKVLYFLYNKIYKFVQRKQIVFHLGTYLMFFLIWSIVSMFLM